MGWEQEWGIHFPVACKFSVWILLGISPAIVTFVLFFLCLFLDKTSYQQ